MSLYLPPEPKPGDAVRAVDIAAIIRAIRSLTPVGGPGVLVNRTSGGTSIRSTARAGGGSPAAVDFPFRLTRVGSNGIRVTPGTVNGGSGDMVPTIGGTLITADPAPVLLCEESGSICLRIDWAATEDPILQDSYVATGAEIVLVPEDEWVDESRPCPADTLTTCWRALGQVTVNESGAIVGTPLQYIAWSLRCDRYGVGDASTNYVGYYWAL